MRVSVIGTIHEPFGCATADALLSILRRLRPEVIFLEMPREAFDEYMDGSRTNLEATAVRLYRAEHPVELVPVDLPTPDPEFFAGWDRVRREVRNRSYEYCRFKRLEEQYVAQGGFDFLNSQLGSQLSADIHETTLLTLAQLANPQLSSNYDAFMKALERREHAMIENIEAYGAISTKSIGVLLIGAAHRRSLHEKSGVRSGAAGYPILWEFPGTV